MAQINKPTDYFNTVLYSGTGSSNSVTGVGFQPDWTWIKSRNNTRNHNVYDSVRGTTKVIYADLTNAESTQASGLTSFNSDGFTVVSDLGVNGASDNYASWNWLAGGTASSNTDGSITSSVSANTTSGFSIGTYTGNSTSGATVGHGLSDTPDWIIVKTTSAADNWQVYHQALGNTSRLELNNTDAVASSTALWNNTSPTSSVFSLGNGSVVNSSSRDYVFYAFAEKKGFSKFGKYRGNSSSDGVFVYLGFKPAMVMVKSNATEAWEILDNKRSNSFNAVDGVLFPNLSNAEETTNDICDFLSNGIKFRHSDGRHNSSAHDTYFMAFAESALVGTNNIPAVAR